MALISKVFQYISDVRDLAPQFKSDSPILSLEPFFRPQRQKLIDLIDLTTYNTIESYILTPTNPVNAIIATATDYLKAALANMLAVPYYIFEAGERNNTESKVYRYQEMQQIEVYLELAWTELNSLLDHLDANVETFTDFPNTAIYKMRSGMFLKNAADFTRYYGAVKSSYFFNNTLYIQEEEINEKIKSRIPAYPTMPNNDTTWYVGKALVYLILSKACIQLDYTELPKSIRADIVHEVTAKKGNENDIKRALSDAFAIEADKYLAKIEFEVNQEKNSGTYVPPTNTLTEDDKFYMPG